jgi:hypothetical protein
MQIASFLWSVIFSCVTCLILPYLSTLSHFRRKVIEHKICFDFLYNFCLKNFSLYEEFSEILSQMYTGFHVKYPLFLSEFNKTQIFSTYFQKNRKYKISLKPVQWEPDCSMRTDGRTHRSMTKLTVAFRHFANAPKKRFIHVCVIDMGTRTMGIRTMGIRTSGRTYRHKFPAENFFRSRFLFSIFSFFKRSYSTKIFPTSFLTSWQYWCLCMNTFFLDFVVDIGLSIYTIFVLLGLATSFMRVFVVSLLWAFRSWWYALWHCVLLYSTVHLNSAVSVESMTVWRFASDCTEHSAG